MDPARSATPPALRPKPRPQAAACAGSAFPYTRRDAAGLAALSLAVGLSGALGASSVLGQGAPLFDGWGTAAVALAGAVLFALAALLVDRAYERVLERPARTLGWERRQWLMALGVMGACWLPWLVANFPGGAYWDTYYQIWQTFPGSHPIALIPFGDHADATRIDAYFCDHHPLLDTLIYGGFAQASQALTGEWQLGVFAFVLVQGAATAAALTGACAYLARIGAPRGAVLAAFGFFCVAPFVSTWALTMVKDSLFSLVYVPYFIMLCEVVRTRGAALGRARMVAAFVALGVLLCLTKKTGLYVVAPTALLGLLLYRRWWRPFALQAAACMATMALVLPLVVFPLLNVAPGGKQETLGPLFQQTAAYAAAYPDDVTDEERATINVVLEHDELAEQYVWSCHDDVKYSIKLSATDQNIRDYIYVWAAQGLRHPDAYLGALMGVAGSYLAPVQALNIRTTTCDTDIDGVPVLYNPPELDWLREGLANAYSAWASVPGLCLPLEACLYVWWLPLLVAFAAWRRRLRCGLLFAPGALVLAFCLIGPIFDARYCLPLLYTVPLLAAALPAFARLRPPLPLRDNGSSEAAPAAPTAYQGKEPR